MHVSPLRYNFHFASKRSELSEDCQLRLNKESKEAVLIEPIGHFIEWNNLVFLPRRCRDALKADKCLIYTIKLNPEEVQLQ